MKPESKKPNRGGWAKCLFILVANRGIEPRTRGFSIPNFWHFSALIAISEFCQIAYFQWFDSVANNPHVETD